MPQLLLPADADAVGYDYAEYVVDDDCYREDDDDDGDVYEPVCSSWID